MAFFVLFGFSLSAQVYDGDIILNTQAEVDSFPQTCNCTAITGFLNISGTEIQNLDSLYSLTFIERYVTIAENEQLTSLEGLSNIVTIAEDLEIINNPALTSFQGLNSLTYIGNDFFIRNTPITDFDGLQNLQVINQGLGLLGIA